VVNYIRNQKEHHKKESTVMRLEAITTMKRTEAKADRVSTLKRASVTSGGSLFLSHPITQR